MPKVLEQLIEQFQREGARRYAAWNADLFNALCAGPVAEIWKSLPTNAQGWASSKKLFEGYLQLLEEAVGRGYVQKHAGGPWSNLMELVLLQFLPEQLAAMPPDKRIRELVKIWNLLEGLLGEPAWINQLVLA